LISVPTEARDAETGGRADRLRAHPVFFEMMIGGEKKKALKLRAEGPRLCLAPLFPPLFCFGLLSLKGRPPAKLHNPLEIGI
jgi:hypothetical protein